VGVLAVSGLSVLVVYLTDRAVWGLLLTAYVLLAVSGLITFAELEILPDPFIAIYVLTAVALPFLVVFLRDRSKWWALIPCYVLVAIAIMIGLTEWEILPDAFVATYVLTAIALPFLVVFLRDHSNWWALIPSYVLLAIGVMVALIELHVLNDLVIPAYVLLAIAFPFFVVYARDPKQWWPLIPGGIVALIGISFLLATEAVQYVGAVVLILAGVVVLVVQLVRVRSGNPSR
jgi:drug/metabolite transporter (DMT)-like permease